MTKTQQNTAPAQGEGKDEGGEATATKPARSTVSAPTLFEPVVEILKAAGPKGLKLKDLAAQLRARGIELPDTSNPYRVLHNATWRLEGSPEVRDKEHFGQLRKPGERQIHRVPGQGATYAIGKAARGEKVPATHPKAK
jgi:hypothetical protein